MARDESENVSPTHPDIRVLIVVHAPKDVHRFVTILIYNRIHPHKKGALCLS